MMFRIFGGKLEREVIGEIERLIELLCSACQTFKKAVEQDNKGLMLSISEMEKEGDSIRRRISLKIYEGAFLPYLRPNIYKLVELIDEVLNLLEDAALSYIKIRSFIDDIREEIVEIADLNTKICRVFSKAFRCLFKGDDLREIALAIRIYERKVDELKHDLISKLIKRDVRFWEGKIVSDFLQYLVSISDLIEDAGDIIQMINVSMR